MYNEIGGIFYAIELPAELAAFSWNTIFTWNDD